ncbi:MAG: hypothetical protein AAGK33_10730 [Pseudomonadota bacterium]
MSSTETPDRAEIERFVDDRVQKALASRSHNKDKLSSYWPAFVLAVLTVVVGLALGVFINVLAGRF